MTLERPLLRTILGVGGLAVLSWAHASPGTPSPASRVVPDVYQELRHRSDIPKEYKEDVESAASGQRDEAIVLLNDGPVYIGSLGSAVVIVLLGDHGSIRDVRYFRATGFSVSWYQGLVVTLHQHPGTGMFHHEPMKVAIENHKLSIEPTDPGWPARHADD